ncbi:MAG: hypothetical protein RIR26_2591 [Pseudomonadota bacterium]|jgi:hypothetical protein
MRTLYHIAILAVAVQPLRSQSAFAQMGGLKAQETKFELNLFSGINTAQLRLKSDSATYLSNGYNGHTSGVGLSIVPRPTFALEMDAVYSNRIFGFGNSKGYFNCLQTPVSIYSRFESFRAGLGLYGSFWRQGGKLLKNGSISSVGVNEAGNEFFEKGILASIGFRAKIKKIPLNFSLRTIYSLGDIAKATSLKGSIAEYQLLVGFDYWPEPQRSNFFTPGLP